MKPTEITRKARRWCALNAANIGEQYFGINAYYAGYTAALTDFPPRGEKSRNNKPKQKTSSKTTK